MALRIPWAIAKRWSAAPLSCVASRRTLSTAVNDLNFIADGRPLRFTIHDTRSPSLPDMLSLMKHKFGKELANPARHNAAVLLTSSGSDMIRWLDDPTLMAALVKDLVAGADIDEFHLTCAGFDAANPLITGMSGTVPAISLLRCFADDLTPQRASNPLTESTEDIDKVGAMAFEMPNACVTVPLARTTFQTGRTSTLIQYRCPISNGSPQWDDVVSAGPKSIRIRLPKGNPSPESVPFVTMPILLRPITPARLIKESFGNIVRSIEVDGQTVPASHELEPAVIGLQSFKELVPPGVWAAVIPEQCTPAIKFPSVKPPQDEWANDPESFKKAVSTVKQMDRPINQHLWSSYDYGGRVFKILSGGGGWGAKKGLLSLDPDQAYFASPEEQDPVKFSLTDEFDVAPAGSWIQYYRPALAPDRPGIPRDGYYFGTPGDFLPEVEQSLTEPICMFNMFGAGSSEAIFISEMTVPSVVSTTKVPPGVAPAMKLSMPHARYALVDSKKLPKKRRAKNETDDTSQAGSG